MVTALITAISLYYLQVYHFYEEPRTGDTVTMTPLGGTTPEEIIADDVTSIDATSSPIRYRACFTTPMSTALLSETYTPSPLWGPKITNTASTASSPSWRTGAGSCGTSSMIVAANAMTARPPAPNAPR